RRGSPRSAIESRRTAIETQSVIRVLTVAEDLFPLSVGSLLKDSSEVRLVSEGAADVMLVYCRYWNQAALAEIRPLGQAAAVPVVVVCDKADEAFRTASILRQEVFAVLQSSVSKQQFIAALRAAAAGLRVLQNFPNTNHRSENSHIILTPRELEILRLIA